MINKKHSQELAKILSDIDSPDLMEKVLDNLLTPQEKEEIAQRIQIFKGLMTGESQRDLAERLGVSLGTISRGSRELQYGQDGIRKVLS
jgi:Trp operon repressor